MKKIGLFLMSVFCFSILSAQENNTITGGVYDKHTREPLISASIYYNKTTKGTLSNAEGEFSIERIVDADSLYISYLGYNSIRYAINQIPAKIYLEPLDINLSEITVTPLDVTKFVKQIWDKYNAIYIEEKENKDKESLFFYRQVTKIDTLYSEFIECFFAADNTFYIGNHWEFRESRYAKIKSDSLLNFTFTNFFVQSVIRPFLPNIPSKKSLNTFLQPNFENIYDVEIDRQFSSDQNENIIVLNFIPKKTKEKRTFIWGKLYVRKSDLAIVRIEGHHNCKLNTPHGRIQNPVFTFSVNYKDNSAGYPQIESINYSLDMIFSYKKERCKIQVTSILFAVEPNVSPDRDLTRTAKAKNLLEIVKQMEYHPEFWKNNPVIKRTKMDEAIIKSFESQNAFGTFKSE